jgi:hypothetical protein
MMDDSDRRAGFLDACLAGPRDPAEALILAERMERFVREGTVMLLLPAPAPAATRGRPRKNEAVAAEAEGEVEESPAGGLGRRRRWTPADDAELRRLWNDGLKMAAIAEAMNGSKSLIRTKALGLGLKRGKGFRGPAAAKAPPPVAATPAKAKTAVKSPAGPAKDGPTKDGPTVQSCHACGRTFFSKQVERLCKGCR